MNSRNRWDLDPTREQSYNRLARDLSEEQLALLKESGAIQTRGAKELGDSLANAANNFGESVRTRRQDKRTQELHDTELKNAEENRQTSALQREQLGYQNARMKNENAFDFTADASGKTPLQKRKEMDLSQSEENIAMSKAQRERLGQLSPEYVATQKQVQKEKDEAELLSVSTMLASPQLLPEQRNALERQQAALLTKLGKQSDAQTIASLKGQAAYTANQKNQAASDNVIATGTPGYSTADQNFSQNEAELQNLSGLIDNYTNYKNAMFGSDKEKAALASYKQGLSPEDAKAVEDSWTFSEGSRSSSMANQIKDKIGKLEQNIRLLEVDARKIPTLQPRLAGMKEQLTILKNALATGNSASDQQKLRNRIQLQNNRPQQVSTGQPPSLR